jgi:hypothetical protein
MLIARMKQFGEYRSLLTPSSGLYWSPKATEPQDKFKPEGMSRKWELTK